jgi:hypothetical protein
MLTLLALFAALLGPGLIPDDVSGGGPARAAVVAPVVAPDVSGGGPAITSPSGGDVSGGGPAITVPPT